MVIMGCRQQMLQWLLNGFKLTGIHLVGHNGTSFVPFCIYDDIGSYILLPSFIRLTGIPLEESYALFYFSMLALSWVVALASLYKLFYQSMSARLYLVIGFLPLLFFIRVGLIGDVYLSYLCAVLCAIPLGLTLIETKCTPLTQAIGFGFIGLVSQLFNYIRSYAALGPLLFVCLYTALAPSLSWQKKMLLLLTLWSGMQLTNSYFNYTIAQYRSFIAQECPQAQEMGLKHVFWHTVYLGFSFLKFHNTENIEWDDSYANQVVREKNPSIGIEQTETYEAILKDMVIDLVKRKPLFVIMTIAAKCGILLFLFLFFMHFGLWAAVLIYRRWQLHLSFIAALGVSMAFPLLSQPVFSYAASFITLTILYSLICICYMLQGRSATQSTNNWRMPFKRFLLPTQS